MQNRMLKTVDQKVSIHAKVTCKIGNTARVETAYLYGVELYYLEPGETTKQSTHTFTSSPREGKPRSKKKNWDRTQCAGRVETNGFMTPMTIRSSLARVLVLGAAGCALEPVSAGDTFGTVGTSGSSDAPEDPSESGDEDDNITTASATSTATAPGTSGEESGTTVETTGNVGPQCFTQDAPPSVVLPGECDPYDLEITQDCADGEKCSYWAADGGEHYSEVHCVPVVESPRQVGDPCTIEGDPLSGMDNCSWDSVCYPWLAGPSLACAARCIGDAMNPTCEDPSNACVLVHGTAALCLPRCNPLDDGACNQGTQCMLSGVDWACMDNAEGNLGPGGEAPCDHPADCSDGYACLHGDCYGKCDAEEAECNCIAACDPDPGYENAGLCL